MAGIYESDHLHGFVRSAEGDITTFDGPGASATYVVGINNSGEVTGWYWDGASSDHALVRAPDGTLTTFDIPGENSTTPSSINEGGVITGSYIGYDGFDHGFIRAANGTITTFDVPGANYGTVAESINVHGDVAGAYWVSNSIEYGFVRRADGTITTFDYQDCPLFDPRGINRKQVVTGWCLLEKRGRFLGFVWRPNRAVRSFHVPGNGPHTRPAAVNDEGVIAGEYDGGGFLRFP